VRGFLAEGLWPVESSHARFRSPAEPTSAPAPKRPMDDFQGRVVKPSDPTGAVGWRSHRLPSTTSGAQAAIHQPLLLKLKTTTLRFRRRASRDVSLAHPFCEDRPSAYFAAILRSCPCGLKTSLKCHVSACAALNNRTVNIIVAVTVRRVVLVLDIASSLASLEMVCAAN
jgi:hypothetical protein